MKLFARKPRPVSAENAAAAVRLSSIASRIKLESAPELIGEEPIEAESSRRLFWTPAELSDDDARD